MFLAALISDASAADSKASLYALIGVVGAALITALGAVLVAYLTKKKEAAAPLDAQPTDVVFMTKAYQDCRTDLESLQKERGKLEWELDEARELNDYFLRELKKRPNDEG